MFKTEKQNNDQAETAEYSNHQHNHHPMLMLQRNLRYSFAIHAVVLLSTSARVTIIYDFETNVEKTFCIVSHGYAVYVDVSLYQLV